MSIRLLRGDCRTTLAGLEPGSVQCVVTSPPFYGLRDYGTPPLVWGGVQGCKHDWVEHVVQLNQPNVSANSTLNPCPAKDNRIERAKTLTTAFCPCGAWLGSLGLEPTPELYVEHLAECFRAVRRVLADSGVVWLNLGDSYAGSGNGSNDYRQNGKHFRSGGDSLSLNADKYKGQKPGSPAGYKAKDLIGIPWMAAFALRADGWYLRSDVIWAKPNPMPESVTDRPTRSHEYLFLLSKSRTYMYDADAIREDGAGRVDLGNMNERGRLNVGGPWAHTVKETAGRNKRSVWTIATQPCKLAHFAVMPDALVEPCIRASTSEKGQCPECGAPWVRCVERDRYEPPVVPVGVRAVDLSRGDKVRKLDGKSAEWKAAAASAVTTGWQPTCKHTCPPCEGDGITLNGVRCPSCDGYGRPKPVPQTVLDCFSGAGTVGLVADRLGRNAVLCELSEPYGDLATDRIVGDSPMFTELTSA